jgi:2-succinyl-5-enolpyruvyl-6-hydroxy-3-cyclohexene-1-carboxylate synthase
VGSFVDELVACGLRDVCLCPGSRSTPLAIAFARHPDVKLWTHLDERSCAYFALGMAKADTTRPVAILCSSGTAAVNFAPAVVEAFHSHVPLIVLTADRPPELQDLSANQTIDQHRLYGPAVKWFSQLPLPEASPEMLRYVRMIADRAVTTTQQAPMGPVHLDLLFREPLVPAPFEYKAEADRRRMTYAGSRRARPAFDAGDDLTRYQRGLIVCGPGAFVWHQSLNEFAERTGFPILADPLSELRGHPLQSPAVITSYDNFLRHAPLAEHLRPDFIIRLGAPPTSKPLATFLQKHRDVPQVVVADPGTWPDPDLTGHEIDFSDDASELFASLLEATAPGHPASSEWLDQWQHLDQVTQAVVHEQVDAHGEISEPSLVLDLAEVVDYQAIVAGNSMPVRDLDSFFFPGSGKMLTRFVGTRGASGIDGVVSVAMGVAARTYGHTVLVIGDISFYHDMNGLLAAQRHNLSATIVLVNNDGGGIFSFLPQHEQSEDFETLFGTPHGLDFSHVGPLYGVGFQRAETRQAYRDALKASFDAPGVQVIEVRTDREENLRLHQRIWAAVAEAVTPLVATGAQTL